MADTLILMRHGKAKRPIDGQPDAERELTEQGTRSLRAQLPHALGLMPAGASVQICSSPAARARQTAQLMLEACAQAGVNVREEIELVEALWEQDFDAVLGFARSCSADVVIAVGHNPFIEIATEKLTGSRIQFATGAFAAITVNWGDDGELADSAVTAETVAALGADAGAVPEEGAGTTTEADAAPEEDAAGAATGDATDESAVEPRVADQGEAAEDAKVEDATNENASVDSRENVLHPSYRGIPTGRLLWFAQGPVSQRWKTLVTMERVLGKAARRVESRREAFIADPDDIETMHKFRVSIRTLRSLIAFVSPWQQSAQNKTCQSSLKRVVGETSLLRELDVLTERAAEADNVPPELAQFCAEQAAEERSRVFEVLSSKRTIKTLQEVIKELENARWRKRVEAEGLSTDEVRAHFDGLVSDLDELMEAFNLADEEVTHDVRKDAKRVRYDAEQFSDLLGADAVGIAKGMVAHQDRLGDVCDARANIRIISEFEKRDVPEPVAWGLAMLRAQNEMALYTTLCSD